MNDERKSISQWIVDSAGDDAKRILRSPVSGTN